MGAILRSSFSHVDNVNVIPVIKTSTWLLLSRLQGNKPHRNSPEPSKPCLRNLHSPEPSGTFRDLPEPTFRNLPEPTSKTYAYTGTLRNPPEPSGICLRDLHHFTPELSGTFRNLSPEPSPFYTGTPRNLPEPASNLHQHTPPAHTGAYLGWMTPLAYAVGEKNVLAVNKWMCLFRFGQCLKHPLKKISFGGIPNSSSLTPCLTTWAHSCSAVVLPMWTMSSPKGVQKQWHSCSCQGCKATTTPKLCSTFRNTSTLRNPPEPSGSCLRNLHSTHRNPPEPSGTCLRNLHQHTPELSGTSLPNLHQHTPELSGTFWNLRPEPAPQTRTGTHRSFSVGWRPR